MDNQVRIGTCGWSYKDWVGVFYPEGAQQRDYLGHYAGQFSTVEVDSTWYAVPRASTVEGWRNRTPDGFLFSAKFPKEITHDLSLVDCEEATTAFLGAMSLLGDRCGPLLLQFPYGFKADRREDLKTYLGGLPDDFRYAVEVRHRSWLETDLLELLSARDVALCLIDHPWFPRMVEATTDFLYVRWMGDRKRIEEDFSHERDPREGDLGWWIENLRPYAGDRRIFGYANNHYTGFGPGVARRVAASLGAGA
jgi:uncharacterized protein YecE (DUF72 family)